MLQEADFATIHSLSQATRVEASRRRQNVADGVDGVDRMDTARLELGLLDGPGETRGAGGPGLGGQGGGQMSAKWLRS